MKQTINIATAPREDLEIAILTNDSLYKTLQKDHGKVEDWVLNTDTETVREEITNFIIENNEATC